MGTPELLFVGLLLIVVGFVIGNKIGHARGFKSGTITAFTQWLLTVEYMAKRFNVNRNELARDALVHNANAIGIPKDMIERIKGIDVPK